MRALLLALLLASATSAAADIGAPLASGRAGAFEVQVLAAPVPLRAGPTEWNVLVRDARSGAVQLDAEVTLELHGPRHGTHGHGHDGLRVRLQPGSAKSRIFHAGRLRLPDPGTWRGTLSLRRGQASEAIPLVFEALPSSPALARHWRAFAVAPLGLALFAVHQWLVRRPRGARRGARRGRR